MKQRRNQNSINLSTIEKPRKLIDINEELTLQNVLLLEATQKPIQIQNDLIEVAQSADGEQSPKQIEIEVAQSVDGNQSPK